ncbi:uncharacterized protein si:ch211-261d7.6 isoform X3 [Haplochromis burtoni]|uniref:uncharacterized protein si:ch211-261d7.6 isoform X3 n=1 Tax=Haplochromis burtoni TaxID=8153 RepID=UPI001C2DEF9D|nr:uncharacterized protein si:ch211-261d7.6 isoform X3 [Haplochromis burtoni]
MEGSASSASVEDGAENKRHADEGTPEENAGPSTEETADNKELSVECKDCGLKFAQQELYETHLHQHAVEDEETPMEEDRTAETVSERADDGESRDEDVRNTLRQGYTCVTCGKNYKYRFRSKNTSVSTGRGPLKEIKQMQTCKRRREKKTMWREVKLKAQARMQ